MKWTTAAALAMAVFAVGTKAEAELMVREVDFMGLDSVEAKSTLREALMKDGIVAMRNVPGLEDSRKQALRSSPKCILGAEGKLETVLEDGTKRASLGARSSQEILTALPIMHHEIDCAGFEKSSISLRRSVQLASQLFTTELDSILNTNVSDVIANGETLEHFHVYTPSEKSDDRTASLDMHTDAGLFIAFTPAMLLRGIDGVPVEDSMSNGFFIETPSGQVAKPIFPSGDDVVVFMIGDGFNQVFAGRAKVPLRPVPHMVRVPGKDGYRSWYGKMFLPSADTILTKDRTFGAIRKAQILAAKAGAVHTSAGCSSATLSLEDMGKACHAGEVYCWMQCVAHDPCPSGKPAVCVRPDKSIWTEKDGHCTNCKVECQNEIHSSNGFCNGLATSMYMEGFVAFGNPDEACLLLLFSWIRLDTAVKFFLGVLGVLCFGIFVEFTIFLRRRYEHHIKVSKPSRWTKIIRTCFYALQLSLAYLAMLIAMTMSVEMFVAVISGLVIGHVVFNSETPVSEFSEPCCAALDDEIGEDEASYTLLAQR